MERVETALIQHECMQLILRYSYLNDLGDWHGLAATFTEDATFTRPSAPDDIIHGRSDAVLNPGGVRIGTAEIYRQVEQFDDIVDAVCVGQQWQDDVRVILLSFLARKSGKTVHIVTNIMVTALSSVEATSRCTIQLFPATSNAEDEIASHSRETPLIGGSSDRFRLESGQWLFSERRGYLTIK